MRTAPAPPSPPPPPALRGGSSRSSRAPLFLAVLPLLLCVMGSRGAVALARGGDPAAGTFQGIASGFQARDAGRVLASVPEQERVTLTLLSPAVSGSYSRPQALRTLNKYFEKVEDVRLQDVTPRTGSTPPSKSRSERIFEYRHRPKGGDAVTTRLFVTVRAAGEGRWVLESIHERPRPGK